MAGGADCSRKGNHRAINVMNISNTDAGDISWSRLLQLPKDTLEASTEEEEESCGSTTSST
jgi:hypothetical protein